MTSDKQTGQVPEDAKDVEIVDTTEDGVVVSFRARTTVPWEEIGEAAVESYLNSSEERDVGKGDSTEEQ